MNTFKFEEPLVLKLMNGDMLSVKYLGKTDEGWLIVKSIGFDDALPRNSELYIEPTNLVWVARQQSQVESEIDSELVEAVVSH